MQKSPLYRIGNYGINQRYYYGNLDNNLVTTGVFIDLKKAFDTIDHSILIKKLCHHGNVLLHAG